MKNSKALLIIDMQKGSFTQQTPRFDTKGVIRRINILGEMFRQADFPVIFIQHDGTKMNEFVPDTTEWELLDELNVGSTDIFINKYANDAFYKSNLEIKLKELNVNELIITGCATDFCVESTVQSALSKDFNVTVVKGAHTTGDRPHLNAGKVIEHYNWVWQNMTPTKGTIRVIEFNKVKIL